MRCVWMCFFNLVACSEFGFHAKDDGNGGSHPTVDRSDTDTVDTADTGSPNGFSDDNPDETENTDSGEDLDTGEPEEEKPPEHVPEVCSVDTMVQMAGTGPADCPTDYAAFMMDDGNGPNFICCPLPSDDILSDEPPVNRSTACEANEVITGFQGEYAYRCTAINLDRYLVGSPSEPCYFGSGSSGGSGVSGCADHPHSWDVLQQSLFGSDGCSGYPYGSLFVSQTDKDCEDMRAVQVLYNGAVQGDPVAGTPVDMFAKF